jgi:hypothetical protein
MLLGMGLAPTTLGFSIPSSPPFLSLCLQQGNVHNFDFDTFANLQGFGRGSLSLWRTLRRLIQSAAIRHLFRDRQA